MITGIAGVALSNATVATFLDPNMADTMADFVALINWGDGHTSSGSIQGGTGVFTVSGTNTYALGGTYTTTVTVVGTGTAPGATTMGAASISNPSEITSTFSFSGSLAPWSVMARMPRPVSPTQTNPHSVEPLLRSQSSRSTPARTESTLKSLLARQ